MKNLKYVNFAIIILAGLISSACSKALTAASLEKPPVNAETVRAPNIAVNDTIRFLEDRGIKYLLLTNNSTTLPSGYVKKLAAATFDVAASED